MRLLRNSLSKRLLADNDSAERTSRRSTIGRVVHARRLNEVRAVNRTDEARPEVLSRVVLVQILETSTRRLATKIVRNLRVNVGRVQRTLTGNSKTRTQLRHAVADVHESDRVLSRNRVRRSRVSRAARRVADIATATQLRHGNRIKRVSHVVSDDVGSSRINIGQREQTQLAGEQGSVAVLVQGHRHRAGVAQGNSIRIDVLSKSAGCLRQILVDLEHDGRTRHGLLHRTLISDITDERLRTQGHLNVAIVSGLDEVSHASLVADRRSTSVGIRHS